MSFWEHCCGRLMLRLTRYFGGLLFGELRKILSICNLSSIQYRMPLALAVDNFSRTFPKVFSNAVKWSRLFLNHQKKWSKHKTSTFGEHFGGKEARKIYFISLKNKHLDIVECLPLPHCVSNGVSASAGCHICRSPCLHLYLVTPTTNRWTLKYLKLDLDHK